MPLPYHLPTSPPGETRHMATKLRQVADCLLRESRARMC